jgi:hypothetical protein
MLIFAIFSNSSLGLQQSIVAAACSRVGISVLHLDRHVGIIFISFVCLYFSNDYYGGSSTSFNLAPFLDWLSTRSEANSAVRPIDDTSNI